MEGRFELYNRDYKNEYIDKFKGGDSTIITIYSAFQLAETTERELNKDLFAFNGKEVEILLYSLRAASVSSVNKYVSIFKDYTNWAIATRIRGEYENGINQYDLTQKSKNLTQFVSNRKVLDGHLSRAQFKDFVNYISNDVDRIIIMLAYELVIGQDYYEMRSLTREDIDIQNNILKVTDLDGTIRKVEVSAKTINACISAANQKKYILKNGMSDTIRPLADTQYIIRPTKRGDNKDMVSKSFIANKMFAISDWFDGYKVSLLNIRDTRLLHELEGYIYDTDYNYGSELKPSSDEVKEFFENMENKFNLELSYNRRLHITNVYNQLMAIRASQII